MKKLSLKLSMRYRNVIKYLSRALIFSLSLNRLKFKTSVNLSFTAMTIVCISSIRICSFDNRTPIGNTGCLAKALTGMSSPRVRHKLRDDLTALRNEGWPDGTWSHKASWTCRLDPMIRRDPAKQTSKNPHEQSLFLLSFCQEWGQGCLEWTRSTHAWSLDSAVSDNGGF